MIELIPSELKKILTKDPALRQSYLVGGCVRDWLMKTPNKDIDIEVFGIDLDSLAKTLSTWGRTDLVGKSFGVIKLKTSSGRIYDFSVPRSDHKTGNGHKGFQIKMGIEISPKQACSRRDFTINSMMYDPRENLLLDFFGGKFDLENRILKHTSDAFSEDPLRVMRGMQIAARYDLKATPGTLELCRSIQDSFNELASERIWEEWLKWATKSIRPSAGIKFLMETGWAEHFPEIRNLAQTPQDPEWHPEGDVLTHTNFCCDAMVELEGWRNADEESRIVYLLAILCHDFGKPNTTITMKKDGRLRIVSPGHDHEGGRLSEVFLDRIQAPKRIRQRVIPLVNNHLAHLQIQSERSVRRLARRLVPETIQGLLQVIAADQAGRPPRDSSLPESAIRLREIAQAIDVSDQAPKPILKGRHLLEIGMTPSPEMGVLLNTAFEAQLNGSFDSLNAAWSWLEKERKGQWETTIRAALEHKIDSAATPNQST
ncbi:MAG TPA: polynucleotide adenylyltransferase [Verrucomicrobia bacterium]|nr:polynucleotide adenylyltransferase [Verrucomicrobiota bacterium]